MKLIMVCIIEKSLNQVLSNLEYSLLDTMRLLICQSQTLDDQIEKVDCLVVDDTQNFGINSYDQIGDKYMSAVVDKAWQQEKDIDDQLMQLALSDITGTLNYAHKFHVISGNPGSDAIKANNSVIEYIFNSKQSFKLVNKIIKMKSSNYLKPFQLSTVMTYVETMYHSNDYVFLRIMAELLNVTKVQIKFWKEKKF